MGWQPQKMEIFPYYMPCYHPLQATFVVGPDGKKVIRFCTALARSFVAGRDVSGDGCLQLPCGRCIGCRLERSRQWAVRIMHEASLHEDNCFLTLTYSDENLPVDGSLVPKHFQDFMKRLRKRLPENRVRFYHCGEYGDKFKRPHYHACVFGYGFPDRKFYKRNGNGDRLYTSAFLDDVWSHGFCIVGDLTFESAAYVARYCTKKVTGKEAKDHYGDRVPEYATMSRRPGIGRDWYDRFSSDCYPSDSVVVRGVECKPPRYYDGLLPEEELLAIKELRQQRASRRSDNSHRRLCDREKVKMAQLKRAIRPLEI